jgi:subtilase family serine protease
MNLKQALLAALAVATIATSSLAASAPVSAQAFEVAEPQFDLVPIDLPDLDLVLPRPDLRIRDFKVIPDVQPNDQDNDVKHHQPYRVCYTVANVGAANAGAFHVRGSALGIGFMPQRAHAGLAAGAMDSNCLVYPATPAPGLYNLTVRADGFNAVAESNEANNALTEAITVW